MIDSSTETWNRQQRQVIQSADDLRSRCRLLSTVVRDLGLHYRVVDTATACKLCCWSSTW